MGKLLADSALKGYKYLGKPNPIASRGLGFLISKKLSHRVSTIEVISKDDNVFWIQVIT